MGLNETIVLILACGLVAIAALGIWNQVVVSRTSGRLMNALLQHTHHSHMESNAAMERMIEKLVLDPKSTQTHAMERTARAQLQTSLERDQIRQEGAPMAPAPPPAQPAADQADWHPEGRPTRNLDAARQ